MSNAKLRSLYEERRSAFEAARESASRKINAISNLRLAAAILFLITLYFSFTDSYVALLAGLLLIGFFILVQFHAKLFRERTHLENLVKINSAEFRALSLDIATFDAGTEFIKAEHPYSHDLDIFGEGSLFQYMNRCRTLNGRKKFAFHLEHPFQQAGEIIAQQQSVADLASRLDFRQHIEASAMETGEQKQDYEQLLQWTKQPSLFKNKQAIRITLLVVPVITLLSLVITFFYAEARVILMLAIASQWIIIGSFLKRINVYHDYISRKKNILEKYSHLLYHVEREQFNSSKLKHLSSQAHEAHKNIKRLAGLVNALDARTNSLATIFVNSFLLYDLQCVYRLEQWREDNAVKLPIWLDTITEVEVLNSLATYSYNNPKFCFPEITAQLNITAENLAHPLIHEDERVTNDLRMGPDPSVLIVTGANMAGKSTFLRTLGVNIVLALNGAPVCATFFKCPVINLRSGMRTADSLKDHQSYFYAELNRLKSIMEELRNDKPLLILLDEILKGTNSNDKQAGSIALVRQLIPHPCLALIATHDLALGDLENEQPGKVKNYCFEANIENDQLSFDYKLKEGIAQKMNASFLMKKMGIIPR